MASQADSTTSDNTDPNAYYAAWANYYQTYGYQQQPLKGKDIYLTRPARRQVQPVIYLLIYYQRF